MRTMGRKGEAFPHSSGRSPTKSHQRSLIWTGLIEKTLPPVFLQTINTLFIVTRNLIWPSNFYRQQKFTIYRLQKFTFYL